MDFRKFDPNDSFATLLNKTTRALSTRLQHSFTSAGLDVTSEQWMILLLLWQKDGRSPWQIAEAIDKDKAAVTRLIDGLEKRNLVFRIADKTDLRQKHVHLTAQGKAMEKKLIPLGIANMAKAQAGLSSKEIETCKAVLQKLYANLSA
jgi:DNA-binding MarR family transcriptional regulator